jgi:transcriptional regulator with GAF, ATPase, and Fis domain
MTSMKASPASFFGPPSRIRGARHPQGTAFLDKTGSRKIERAASRLSACPSILHARAIGVLNVDRLFGDEVSFEEDVAFLSVVATLIAQFMSLNRKFEAKVEDLKRENVSLKYKLSRKTQGCYIVGKSLAMQKCKPDREGRPDQGHGVLSR